MKVLKCFTVQTLVLSFLAGIHTHTASAREVISFVKPYAFDYTGPLAGKVEVDNPEDYLVRCMVTVFDTQDPFFNSKEGLNYKSKRCFISKSGNLI